MKTTSLYTYCTILLVAATLLFSARVKGQTTLLTEGWESAAIGQTPPSGWSIDLGNSTNHIWFKQLGINPNCNPSSGNRMVEFQTVQYGYGIHDRLRRTVPFSTLGFSVVNVDFKWFTSTWGGEYTDRVVVEYSVNGTNWVNVGTFYRHSWDNTWRYENINLPTGALNNPSVYIAFHFYGWVGENCHLDDVHVTGYATTPTPPTVTTSNTTYVASTLANVTGSVNANGNTTSTRFQYGTNTAYGNECESSTVTGNSTTPISVILGYQEPLIPGKLYHYRAVGTSAGGTIYGNDMTFTTYDSVPTATTWDAYPVASTTATIYGVVSANGDSTSVSFDYGTTTAYGTNVAAIPSVLPGDSILTTVLKGLTGLTPNTLYHYRVKATNSLGTSYGVDSTFVTTGSSTIPPTAITSGATNISLNGATLNGMVNPNGSTTTTTFQYGLTTSYGNTVSCGSQTGTSLLPVS